MSDLTEDSMEEAIQCIQKYLKSSEEMGIRVTLQVPEYYFPVKLYRSMKDEIDRMLPANCKVTLF